MSNVLLSVEESRISCRRVRFDYLFQLCDQLDWILVLWNLSGAMISRRIDILHAILVTYAPIQVQDKCDQYN